MESLERWFPWLLGSTPAVHNDTRMNRPGTGPSRTEKVCKALPLIKHLVAGGEKLVPAVVPVKANVSSEES
jgi:hypothetical protein